MRVLVVKLGAMGDVIMSLTMVTALRALDPTAHLTWIVGQASRPILDLVAGIDKIICVDERRIMRGTLREQTQAVFRLWLKLAGRHFDLVITAHADRRYRILSLPVVATERRAWARGGRAGPLPGRYHASEYARLISNRDGPASPNYDLPQVAQELPRLPFDRCDHQALVVLAPGGARNVMRDDPLRRWPIERYVELARALLASGCTVVAVGAKHELHVGEAFAGTGVISLVGRTSFPELVATIRAADVVVTHDSLALHLSRLARTPVVALFGPTSPHEKVPPVRSAGPDSAMRVLWGGENLPCRPCYDGVNYFACPVNKCMRDISSDEVMGSIRGILAVCAAARRGDLSPELNGTRK